MAATTSLQLFTVEKAMEENLEEAIAEVARRGFTAVEPYDFVRRADRIAEALRANGLTAPSGHAFVVMESFVNPDGSSTEDGNPTWEETFRAAEVLGMQLVIEPYTEPELWATAEGVEHIAKRLNEAAKVAAEHGIRVGYHNHAHEVEARIDGVTGLEYLARHLDPEVVLEVDLYWVQRAGVSPVELVGKLGDRVRLVHVKDGSLDPELVQEYPPTDQVVAGEGVVELRTALDQLPQLELAVVEFDHYPGGDIFDGIEASRRFLDGEGQQ